MVVATMFVRAGSHLVSLSLKTANEIALRNIILDVLQTGDGQKFASKFKRSLVLRKLCSLPRLKSHRARPAPQMSMLSRCWCKPLAKFCPGSAPQKSTWKRSTLISGGGGGRRKTNLIVKFQHMLTCKLLSVTSPHPNVEGIACRLMGARPRYDAHGSNDSRRFPQQLAQHIYTDSIRLLCVRSSIPSKCSMMC